MPDLYLLYAGALAVGLLAYGLLQSTLWRYWRALPRATPPPDYRPTTSVSILLPARNEAGRIRYALRDLLAQRYPGHRLELLVIDDHSTDATATEVAACAEPGVRLLRLADYLRGRPVVAYKKAALEYGVAQSTGELIVTTDADCRFPRDWLRTLVFAHETRELDLICAPVRIAPATDFLTTFQALDLAAYMLLTGATIQAGRPLLANGANLAFTRALFSRVGGYAGLHDYASGDDVLLLQKVTTAGAGRVGFVAAAGATVDTLPVPTWAGLWRQRLRWAGKTGGYADRALVFLQGGVYLFSLLILAGLCGGPLYDGRLALVAAAGWGGKSLVDFLVLRRLSYHFGRPAWLRWYLPTQLLYPIYLVAVGTVALLRPSIVWKERAVR